MLKTRKFWIATVIAIVIATILTLLLAQIDTELMSQNPAICYSFYALFSLQVVWMVWLPVVGDE